LAAFQLGNVLFSSATITKTFDEVCASDYQTFDSDKVIMRAFRQMSAWRNGFRSQEARKQTKFKFPQNGTPR
jgi:hypothetical protein